MTQSQFAARPNWMFTEPTPNFIEGAGYGYRFGPQGGTGPELQMPHWENSELLHDIDAPFGISNDQWIGLGGLGNKYA